VICSAGRYDPDLLHVFHDVGEEYTSSKHNMSLTFQFQRLLKIVTFLGLGSTEKAQDPMELLIGGASYTRQLHFLHSFLDLIFALPRDPFFASHAMYSTQASYAAHNDPEFHKHVRMLHCVTTNSSMDTPSALAQYAGQQQPDSILTDHLELFPPTLMLAAQSYKALREKQGYNRRGM
jgi:hypothetical protein